MVSNAMISIKLLISLAFLIGRTRTLVSTDTAINIQSAESTEIAGSQPQSDASNHYQLYDSCIDPESGLSGICVVNVLCSKSGGRFSDGCGFSFVCCVNIVATCDALIALNSTYWQSPPFLIGPLCTMVVKMDSDVFIEKTKKICQVRLDFMSFNIAQQNIGRFCDVDIFQVNGAANTVPAICGDASGQHMYIEPLTSTMDLKFSFRFGQSSAKRSWNIKVSMFACGDAEKLAPKDCLQYFSSLSGTVKGFNWKNQTINEGLTTSKTIPNPHHKQNPKDYVICFHNELRNSNYQKVSNVPYYFSIPATLGFPPTNKFQVAEETKCAMTNCNNFVSVVEVIIKNVGKVLDFLAEDRWEVARNLRDKQRTKIDDTVDQVKTLTHQLKESCGIGNWPSAMDFEKSLIWKLNNEITFGVKDALVYIFIEDFVDISVQLKQFTDTVLAPEEIPSPEGNFEDKAQEVEKFSARIVQTARLLAAFGGSSINLNVPTVLFNSSAGQVESLTPLLVEAGRIRINTRIKTNDAAADEHFEDLCRQYSEAVARIRQHCDDIVFWAVFTRSSEKLIRLFMDDCEDAIGRQDSLRLIDNTSHITRLAKRVLMIFKKETGIDEEEEEDVINFQRENHWKIERVKLYRKITSNSAAKMEADLATMVLNANLLTTNMDDQERVDRWRISIEELKASLDYVCNISENILRFIF